MDLNDNFLRRVQGVSAREGTFERGALVGEKFLAGRRTKEDGASTASPLITGISMGEE